MPLIAQIFAGIAAALHVLFFYLESVAFTKGSTYKSFGLATKEEADVVKPMALNQGFYNLFLAIGVVVGLVVGEYRLSDGMRYGEGFVDGTALVGFGCAVMVGAAIVLLISSKGKLLRGALIQGVAPLIALIALIVG
ncbi:MAG: DUF1304 domain-containing protein [Solirubrobacteraceae bacterium]|nr:DUF1304 domain-containing protein [Solirubrobacteraceae bacterium]